VRTILLVEDEAVLRRSLRAVLEAAGFRVFEAGDATEALLMLSPHDAVDLLLTDILLPGVSGIDLAQRLANDRRELRLLLMSAQEPPREVHDRGLRFLAKPFTREALLALIEEALRAPPTPPRSMKAARPQRVLLVDDEEAIRRSVSRFLRRRGHEVLECSDGEEALRALTREPGHEAFDVVISDVHLPGGGGHFLLRLGSARQAVEEKLLLITGDSEGSPTSRELAGRGVEVLYKPFDLDELTRLVEAF
jgi:DNA-binding NtrC family response regulator